jgi:flagellar biosynthesis protein FliQ
MPSPTFDAMLAAILDLAQPIVLAALIVGLLNELAGPEESEE